MRTLPTLLATLLLLALLPTTAAAQITTGYPNANNTGVTGCPTLTPRSGGLSVTQNGAVIENLDITGQVQINANNVTLRCVRVRDNKSTDYAIRNTSYTGLTLDHIDVSCMNSLTPTYAIGTAYYTATAVNVTGCQDGFIAAWNTTIRDSYCHDLLSPPIAPNAHTQCVQVMGYGGTSTVMNNIDILHNTFLPAAQHATAAIIIKADFGRIDDVLVDNNLMDYGAFTVYSRAGNCCTAPTNVRFTNNRFRRHYEFGLKSFDGTVGWTNNVWDDTGQTIPINDSSPPGPTQTPTPTPSPTPSPTPTATPTPTPTPSPSPSPSPSPTPSPTPSPSPSPSPEPTATPYAPACAPTCDQQIADLQDLIAQIHSLTAP